MFQNPNGETPRTLGLVDQSKATAAKRLLPDNSAIVPWKETLYSKNCASVRSWSTKPRK